MRYLPNRHYKQSFGVSRVTVRQAFAPVSQQQILESIQGSGTYVKKRQVNYDIFQLTSFDEKLSDRHVDTHSEVLIFEVIRLTIFFSSSYKSPRRIVCGM